MVRSRRCETRSGRNSTESRFYLSGAHPDERTPARWQALIRGHWAGVENRNHWRRDALWGEDKARTPNPAALAHLALVRNALFALLPEHYPDTPLPRVKERLHSRPRACLQGIRS